MWSSFRPSKSRHRTHGPAPGNSAPVRNPRRRAGDTTDQRDVDGMRSEVFEFWVRMSRSRLRLTNARVTRMNAAAWSACAVALTCLFLAGCDAKSEKSQVGISGDPKRGMDLVKQYGCGGWPPYPGGGGRNRNDRPPQGEVGPRAYI